MSTIFKCQENIKNYFPEIKRVRLYPVLNKDFELNVYYEDSQGNFNSSLIPKLQEILPCHILFNFKPYNELLIDNVPLSPSVPELIENLALKSTGTLKSFTGVVEKAFSDLMPINIKVSDNESIISIETNQSLSHDKLNIYNLYAQELAPIGCKVTIVCI